jgi:hypothetical protein
MAQNGPRHKMANSKKQLKAQGPHPKIYKYIYIFDDRSSFELGGQFVISCLVPSAVRTVQGYHDININNLGNLPLKHAKNTGLSRRGSENP